MEGEERGPIVWTYKTGRARVQCRCSWQGKWHSQDEKGTQDIVNEVREHRAECKLSS